MGTRSMVQIDSEKERQLQSVERILRKYKMTIACGPGCLHIMFADGCRVAVMDVEMGNAYGHLPRELESERLVLD